MSGQHSTIRYNRVSLQRADIIFSNPPVGLMVMETVERLHDLVTRLERDEQLQVVVLRGDNDLYWFNHFDLTEAPKFSQPPPAGELPLWTDMVIRLSKAPFISIAAIRGRTRGGGNELALACDLRYASREKAIFGQPEVGSGAIPGGGGGERLPRQIGRDRALEVLLSSQDYDAQTAEKWGWVTRALPDRELDRFVDRLADRLCSFDKTALAAAKAQVSRATLPPDADLEAAYHEFVGSMDFPGYNPRASEFSNLLLRWGVHDLEKRLGFYLGLMGKVTALTKKK